MKKFSVIFLVILLSISIFVLGFGYKNEQIPSEYYDVYLDDVRLGTISSKEELESYIDKEGEHYKDLYKVENVYAPTGLEIRKVVTFDNEVSDVATIYEKIKNVRPFTIRANQLTIKRGENHIKLYALNEDIFKDALESAEITFSGDDGYNAYKNNTQDEIKETGKLIKNIYISTEFTIKRDVNVSVDEKIYTDYRDLAQFLIFGNNTEKKTYYVKAGDTINSIAFDNQISVTELLVSNPKLTTSSNLLFPGEELLIGITDPQVDVVVVEYVVEDVASNYKIIEKYDSSKYSSYEEILTEGVQGLDRISKTITTVNGVVNDVNTESKVVMRAPVDKVLLIGTKKVSGIGSLTNWGWPTNSGWTISSEYAYRINPISGKRELHTGLDISGTGAGSPIYAANNGIVIRASWYSSYGNCIIIDHQNGYYTLYGHLQGYTVKEGAVVERGQQIGKMGKTGAATGYHLHFEVWTGGIPWRGGQHINPWLLYQ